MTKQKEIIPQEETIHPHLEATQKYRRNDWGLINNFPYKFNDDGSINYKSLINPKYIVLNKERRAQIETTYSRNFDELQLEIQEGKTDPNDIQDGHKLILLAGIKELAKLRGYNQVSYHNNVTGPEYVAVNCEIQWIPNYETNNKEVRFSSLADAHLGNVSSFAVKFLNSIAENRAFVRAVRNFLNIHVVGFDELGAANPIEENQSAAESTFSATDPRFLLEKSFNELNSEFKVSWVNFAKYLEEKKEMDGATAWKTVKDVPKERAYDVIGLVKEQIEKKHAKLNN